MKEYVELRNGGYYVKGKRLMLDTVIVAFQRGASPERIHEDYPFLTLEEVYGCITFYLSNKEEVERVMREGEEWAEANIPHLSEANLELYERLMKVKAEWAAKRA